MAAAHLGPAVGSGAGPALVANHAGGRPVHAHADTLIVGRIITNNPAAPSAEAMAVSGGQIIGIGALSEVEGLTDPNTTTIKPDGVVLPGLIEPHMHIWTSLLNLTWTDLSAEACPKFDDVIAALKSAAAQTPKGGWVRGKLFDPSLYPGEPSLTCAMLDTAVPDHPVLVMNASMHYLYANSPAFAEAGITDQTPDPPGGEFGRADGKLNGIIGEAPAMMMMMAKLPRPSQSEIRSGITQILNACAAQGVTSLREAATGAVAGPQELAMLHQMNGAQRLPVRVSTAQFAILAGCAKAADVAAAWTAAGVTPFSGDEMVRADAWKVVVDGSNQGRSGYFFQPYLGEDTGGHANLTPEGLHDALKAGLDGGWQLMVHTNGDAAVEFALTAMEQLLPGYPANDLRHRFEHVSFTTDDQLTRMAKAGISPSFLMNHVYYWGAAFRDTILGPARAARLDRAASAYRVGLRPSFHSDYNVTKVHPLQSARTGALRQLQVDDSVLNPAECVPPEQALAAITTHAAWQIHADDRGSLEVGKRADFALADANPWESDPATWDHIAFHATYIDGTPAWTS
ncbi:MAG TPA: amidohydrolase [Mycobacterium sp.]|nr:amidohydrolase [Mycobacterium sp.]